MFKINKKFNNFKDLVNGIYSGIPLCCIKYYNSLGDYPALADMDKRGIKYKLIGDNGFYMEDDKEHMHEYIVCLRCRENNNFIKIKNNGVLF